LLKLDRYKYVRHAEHGLTPLSRTERKSVYRQSVDWSGETGAVLETVDTPFGLVDATLFAQLVDLKDRLAGAGAESLSAKSYAQLWNDMCFLFFYDTRVTSSDHIHLVQAAVH
jgi:hypothetical protein